MLKIEGEFIEELIKNQANIFLVGGVVRDYYLSNQNKDIDLLVSGLHIDKIITILSKHGDVDIVGASFGVIKFKERNTSIEYDIALPRKEVKTGAGHKGFDVIVNHEFSILDDLERRDYTINSIAYEITEDTIIDPYNGVLDLGKKLLRCVSSKSFIEDPLRILRGLQFSARFNFEIEEQTKELMQASISSLREISPERIYIEFEKGFMKGNPIKFLELIQEFKIDRLLFSTESNLISNKLLKRFEKSKQFSERLFLAFNNDNFILEEVLRTTIMLTNEECDKIKALRIIEKDEISATNFFEACKSNFIGLDTEIFVSPSFKVLQQKFISNEFPKQVKDLQINGKELMELGYFGVDIKNKQMQLINKIFNLEIKNTKESILNNL